MFVGAKATGRDVIRHEGADKCVIECWISFGGVPEFKGADGVDEGEVGATPTDANEDREMHT